MSDSKLTQAHIDYVKAGAASNDFMFSMHSKITKLGPDGLSPKMVAAIIRGYDRQQAGQASRDARAAALVNAPAIQTGPGRTITGRILKAERKWSQWGENVKATIEDSDGNRYYGTVPERAQFIVGYDEAALAGLTITLKARVDPSRDNDPHFAFFSRPKMDGPLLNADGTEVSPV